MESKKGGGAWCSAPNCNHSRNKGWKMHRFPRNEARCKQWVQNCRREDLRNKTTRYLSTNCYLCSEHFEDNQYWNVNKKAELGLLTTAVPTIFNVPNPPPRTATKRLLPNRKHPPPKREKRARTTEIFGVGRKKQSKDGAATAAETTAAETTAEETKAEETTAAVSETTAETTAAATGASETAPVVATITAAVPMDSLHISEYEVPTEIRIEVAEPYSNADETNKTSVSLATQVAVADSDAGTGGGLLVPKKEQHVSDNEDAGEPVEEPLWCQQQAQSPEKTEGSRTGFRSSFLHSPAYLLWKHVGDQHKLQEDEDIACFLLSFYADTTSVALSGLTVCPNCGHSLSACCTHCQHIVFRHPSSASLLESLSNVSKSQSLSGYSGQHESPSHSTSGQHNPPSHNPPSHNPPPYSTSGQYNPPLHNPSSHNPPSHSTSGQYNPPSHNPPSHSTSGQYNPASHNPPPYNSEQNNLPSQNPPPYSCGQYNQAAHSSSAQQQMQIASNGVAVEEAGHMIKGANCSNEWNHSARIEGAATGEEEEPADADSQCQKTGSVQPENAEQQDPRHSHNTQHKSVESSFQREIDDIIDDCIDDGGDDYDEDIWLSVTGAGRGDNVSWVLCKESSVNSSANADNAPIQQREGQTAELCAGDQSTECDKKTTFQAATDHKKISLQAVSEHKKIFPQAGTDHKKTSLQAATDHKKTSLQAATDHKKTSLHAANVQKKICDKCGKGFSHRKLLTQHLRRNHGPKFECSLCGTGKRFTFQNLKGHYRRMHPSAKFDRSVCNQSFSSEKNQQTVKEIKCDVCGKTFTNTHSQKLHTLLHTGQQPFVCEICGKAVLTKLSLSRHVQTHSTHKEYLPCDVCSKVYSSADALKRHKKRHSDFKFVCDICGKAFVFKLNLTQHQRSHREDKYVCDVCNMSFTCCKTRNAHRAQHPEKKPFACDLCDKSYTAARNLWLHKRIHSGLKCHTCDECGKLFTCASALKSHKMYKQHRHSRSDMRKSTTLVRNGKYVCSICNKSFNYLSASMYHEKIHADLKPYSCNFCGRTFRGLSNCKRHMKTHTGERPFPCNVCGKRFGQKVHMLVHHRSHTGERPYECDVCGKTFSELRSRRRHKEKNHPADCRSDTV